MDSYFLSCQVLPADQFSGYCSSTRPLTQPCQLTNRQLELERYTLNDMRLDPLLLPCLHALQTILNPLRSELCRPYPILKHVLHDLSLVCTYAWIISSSFYMVVIVDNIFWGRRETHLFMHWWTVRFEKISNNKHQYITKINLYHVCLYIFHLDNLST